jgi:hypothetical protein
MQRNHIIIHAIVYQMIQDNYTGFEYIRVWEDTFQKWWACIVSKFCTYQPFQINDPHRCQTVQRLYFGEKYNFISTDELNKVNSKGNIKCFEKILEQCNIGPQVALQGILGADTQVKVVHKMG